MSTGADLISDRNAESPQSGRRLRIAFVISLMGAGGAERVAATLCNAWVSTGHDVHLVTFEAKGAASHYPLDAALSVHQLDLLRDSVGPIRFLLANLRRLVRLRRELDRIAPDIVVAFMPETNVLTILASVQRSWQVVASERVHPAYMPFRRIPHLLQRATYPLAAMVIAQTGAIAAYIERAFHAAALVIPNPLDRTRFNAPTIIAKEARLGSRRSVTAVGRLEPQKGFDLVIDAFARIAAAHPGWDLTIYGEGTERAALERRIAGHGLADRVFLPGLMADIAPQLRRSDLFVHAAHFEGFPNAVMEALASSCAVIATDSPGGVRSLLGGGAHGRLVPVNDVAALAAAMDEIMADDGLRARMALAAPAAVAELDAGRIAERWLRLFRHCLAASGAATPFHTVLIATDLADPKPLRLAAEAAGDAILVARTVSSEALQAAFELEVPVRRHAPAGLLARIPGARRLAAWRAEAALVKLLRRVRPRRVVLVPGATLPRRARRVCDGIGAVIAAADDVADMAELAAFEMKRN